MNRTAKARKEAKVPTHNWFARGARRQRVRGLCEAHNSDGDSALGRTWQGG